MADDFKERKPRYGWAWAIITIGMILAVILWLFTFDDGLNEVPPAISEEVASQQMDQQVDIFDVSANPIIVRPPDLTAFSDFFGSARMGELAGRDVDLQAVPVESVTGDTALWIGENADRRVFVIFDELPTTAIDGRLAIEAGDNVNITGEVRLADNIPDGVTVNIPASVQALVYANKLSKVE
jgi:hypothetical protein